MVAEVVINRAAKDINRIFDYIVPKDMEDTISIGNRVFVPFGASKKVEGFIVNLKDKSEFANKNIISIEDNFLTEENMKLAILMSNRYFCSLSECMNLMLPPGKAKKNIEARVKDKKGNFVVLKKDYIEIENEIKNGIIKSQKQIKILSFLKDNNEIYSPDLQAITESSLATLKTLEKKGYIEFVEKNIERNPFEYKKVERDKKLILNDEQRECYEQVTLSIEEKQHKEFLLYGVTGSR